MYAAWEGRLDTVKALLEGGANPDATTKEGWTARALADQKNQTEVVRYLDQLE